MINADTVSVLSQSLYNPFTLQRMVISKFAGQRFLFCIGQTGIQYKIFQIAFGSDGSLYVTLPYFSITEGIVSTAKVLANSTPTDIDLTENGILTSNRVKFAHHGDGEVHFSQSGKVRTEVRKKSLPLVEHSGHIFSIYLQGLSYFARMKKQSAKRVRYTKLYFNLEKDIDGAIKFIGSWYRLNELARLKVAKEDFGPTVPTETPTGKIRLAFLIGPSQGNPLERYVLVVSCEQIPFMTDDPSNPFLDLIGGFDPPDIVHDHSKDTSFLCVTYPASDYESLLSRLGTIDLR